MPNCVIKIDKVSKRYVIGHQPDARNGLRHALEDAFRNPVKWARTRAFRRGNQESFWALRDVSFEINQGDVVGIIGRNGAGKSTLLKVLSRITEPTHGVIEMNGRVASLLEVGTGFHQELTGRENIFLNGAILGMSKAEIKRKFDEIVAFSEVEKFLDTPVKRYSSGMYVRLAFAVAAHLDPEILIVDEVLAVGDAAFQKKCLGKMGEVAKGGRTVLFVSHNMAAVQHLCNRCVMLDQGSVYAIGDKSTVIASYLQNGSAKRDTLGQIRDRTGSGVVKLIGFQVQDASGKPVEQVQSGSDCFLLLEYVCDSQTTAKQVDVGISIHENDETILAVTYASYECQVFDQVTGKGYFKCRLEKLPLQQGQYLIGARVLCGGVEADWPRRTIGQLNVVAGNFFRTGSTGFEGRAPLLIRAEWTAE